MANSGRNKDTDGKDSPKPKAKDTGVDNAEFVGYVNLQLSDDEKAVWAAWADTTAVWDVLQHQVSVGVNVSIKRERAKGGFLASATQRDPASPNAGLCVTARGRTAADAFTRVLFCLSVLDRTESWLDTQQVASPDRW